MPRARGLAHGRSGARLQRARRSALPGRRQPRHPAGHGVACRRACGGKSTYNGSTANALVPDTLTDLGGGACFNDARVQVALARQALTVRVQRRKSRQSLHSTTEASADSEPGICRTDPGLS